MAVFLDVGRLEADFAARLAGARVSTGAGAGTDSTADAAAAAAAEAGRATVAGAGSRGWLDADVDLFVGQNGRAAGNGRGDGAERFLRLRLVDRGCVFDARGVELAAAFGADFAARAAAARGDGRYRHRHVGEDEFAREVDEHQGADRDARHDQQRNQPARYAVVRADAELLATVAGGGGHV